MKRILTAVAILLAGAIGHSVWAQSYTVKGVVVDDQGPVIGANVMVPGTTVGTATGLDGDFILTVASPDTEVEFSCIGYATQVFKASDVPERVVLLMDTEFLDDVVVIGYGTVKKNDMTGSITAIKPEEINRGAFYEGSKAGVLIRTSSSQFKISQDGVAYTALDQQGQTEVRHIIKSLIEDYNIDHITYASSIVKVAH